MKFAFSWDRYHMNRWSWLPVLDYRPLSWGRYTWFETSICSRKLVEKHLYIFWGYAQLHWVWGDHVYA